MTQKVVFSGHFPVKNGPAPPCESRGYTPSELKWPVPSKNPKNVAKVLDVLNYRPRAGSGRLTRLLTPKCRLTRLLMPLRSAPAAAHGHKEVPKALTAILEVLAKSGKSCKKWRSEHIRRALLPSSASRSWK